MTTTEAWELAHLRPVDLTPTGLAAWRNTRRPAVAALADLASRLPRIVYPLARLKT